MACEGCNLYFGHILLGNKMKEHVIEGTKRKWKIQKIFCPESLKVVPPGRAKGRCHDLTKIELIEISDDNFGLISPGP